MTTNEESDFLRGIGERNLSVIRQLAAGMNLGNVEVTATFDDQVEIKEFTIRGLLLPLSPEEEEEMEKKKEERIRKLLDQLKQG